MTGIITAEAGMEKLIEEIAALDEAVFSSNVWGLEAYRSSAANDFDHLTAYCEGDSISGFALLRCFDDAELIRIAAAPSARRRGTGRQLLLELISETKKRGISNIWLEVRSSNMPAIEMYRAAGFEEAGVRKGYYSDPKDDAIIMRYTC